jgi:hypothetical protein
MAMVTSLGPSLLSGKSTSLKSSESVEVVVYLEERSQDEAGPSLAADDSYRLAGVTYPLADMVRVRL